MQKMRYQTVLPLLLLLGLTGCIDSNYDLSDINTETEIRVNNLTVPVNIDELTLDDVISLEDESKIKVVDGKYAVLVEGDFHSDEINIGAVHAAAPHIDPNVTTLHVPGGASGSISGVTFDVPAHASSFSYTDDNIDGAIKSIDEVDLNNFYIEMCYSIPALKGYQGTMKMTDVEIELPKGLLTDDPRYDKTTGILRENTLEGNFSGVRLRLPVKGVETAAAGVVFDRGRDTYTFHGDIRLKSAKLTPRISGSASNLPTDISLRTEYTLPELDVDNITGNVEYDVNEFNINPITLDDLPSFLAQSGTDIILGNPQIYITINNPMGVYGGEGSTGITLTPWRDNVASAPVSLDKGTFSINDKKGTGPYTFCLSPEKPAKYYQGFEGADHVAFTGLKTVLSGEGLPTRIEVDAANPHFSGKPVRHLPVGRSLTPVEGKYTFYAPLALEAGSKIVYTKRNDGWSDEDLDAVTIETLELTADVTSDINQTVRISGYPLGTDGQPMDVQIEGAEIPANADNYHITIRTTGVIRHLDGFVYTATAASAGAEPLGPDQHITLKNIRAKVSGKYVKEL